MYRQFHCWWAFVFRLIPCCLVAAVPRPTQDQESGSIDWSLHQRTMSPLFTVFFVSPTPFSFIFFLFVTQCEMRRNGQHFPMIEDCSSIRRHHPYFSSLSLICLLMPFVFHFFFFHCFLYNRLCSKSATVCSAGSRDRAPHKPTI